MALQEKVRLGGQVARMSAHMAWERAARPRATTLQDVPTHVEAITPEWLAAVLCSQHPGATVTDVEFGGLSVGTTTRRALTVTYNRVGRDAGLPTAVFAKTSASFTSRLIVGLSGANVNEGGFYRSIRPGLEVVAPHGYHLAFHEGSLRAVLLMEDVAVTRGARFLHADVAVDRAMAESQMRTLAAFHGPLWEDPRLTAEYSWLATSLAFQERFNAVANFRKRTELGLDRFPHLAPAALHDRRGEVWPATMRSLHANVRGPQTLLHHDVHIGNWFQEAGGEMGLYDWQATVRGGYACDIAYALSAALEVEDRRAWEEDLIRCYLDALPVGDDRKPTFDDAWLAYRQQQFHGLIYWLFTIAQGRFQPAMQPHDVTAMIVERMAHAVVDLGSLDLV